MDGLRAGYRGGWLLYAGDVGVVAGRVLHADLSVRHSMIDVTSIASPDRLYVQGTREVTLAAELHPENMTWDRPGPSTAVVPNLKALMALARRHPGEYDELREGEEIMKALGG